MSFQVVFNLYPFDERLFLPNANIVQTDAAGALTHIFQKATPETIPPYSIVLTPLLERLFAQIELLTPRSVEARFKPPKAKNPTPLAQLLATPETKTAVESFIFNELSQFLNTVASAGLPLTLDAEKRSLAKDMLIASPKEELVPHLHFRKTAAGVEYRLRLGTEDEHWAIREREVVPLTNTEPAWILVGQALFRVPGINGNMVRPFLKKDVVEIPGKNLREYFQKIIVKNANRTQIEPEGFDLDLRDRLLGAQLRLEEDFLQKTWFLSLLFRYEGREFAFGEKRKQVTWVEFPDDAPIALRQVRRDFEAENRLSGVLKSIGLSVEGRSFRLPGQSGLESAIAWLAEHRTALETAGFQVLAPEIEGKKVSVFSGEIQLRSSVRADWFDVFGTIRVGPFEFSFRRLAPFIRRGERYFPLPDGTVFLIPETWLTRYGELARVAREGADESLQVPKPLFTVVEALGLAEGLAEFPVVDPEMVDYQPSEHLRATLRPYQLAGVKWLIGHQQHGFGACLADDMGLGKTLQTIAVLLFAKEKHASGNAPSPAPEPSKPALPAPKPASKNLKKSSPAAVQLDLFAAPAATESPAPAFENIDNQNFTKKTPGLAPQNGHFKSLIILPASLVFNWRAELDKFAPGLFVNAHVGPKRLADARAIAAHNVVLTTYHTARNDLDLLGGIEWDYVVLDESQQIKNRDSEISKVVRGLRARHKVSLSGTPIENSLADLWTQMEFINPATLGTFREFREQFLLPIERFGDEAAKAALFRRVRPFFLRRTKEEVAPELPPLTEQIFFSEMAPAQKRRYESVKSAVRNQILSLFDDPKTRILAIQALTRLRQIANHPDLVSEEIGLTEATETILPQNPENSSGKFQDVLEQWNTIRRAGHKVLIFSSFEKHLRLFRAVFEAEKTPFAWLTGDTPSAERGREVARFQGDPTVQAFFMTTKAGGVGLNLTAADYVFVLDPWWNPATEAQAIARAHRIGQERPVTAIRFIARETIEEKIRDLQERKARLGLEFFAAGEEMPTLGREDLEMLLS